MSRTIYGVDFSGAVDAGRRIWVTRAIRSGLGLRVEATFPAHELPGATVERASALAALRTLIRASGASAWGFDVPFGLPRALVHDPDWRTFALNFPRRYATPEAFHDACHRESGGREIKRVTDVLAKTPFNSFNLRLYRQTFYGIGHVLAPLVAEDAIRVVPMQSPRADAPMLMEICAACTLKREALYEPYKSASKDRASRRARARILDAIVERFRVELASRALARRLLDDPRGDALDSLIGACAVARTLSTRDGLQPRGSTMAAFEGYVYV